MAAQTVEPTGPGECPSWCTAPHHTGLTGVHSRVCAEFTTRHGEVSVELEQSGEWPPVIALSIATPDPAPDAGFTHLDADQARALRDTLSSAVDLLT